MEDKRFETVEQVIVAAHELRKKIDGNIQEVQAFKNALGGFAGGREISLAYTKIQESKMWVGKVLEALNAPFPEELRDEAK
jgi:hypothetical protein